METPKSIGPWTNEPHFYICRYKNLICMARRGPLFNWCGYVEMPLPLLMPYDSYGFTVHGGVTFGDSWGDINFLGFDTAHCGDLMPLMQEKYPNNDLYGGEYRDLEYVKSQMFKLADQILEFVQLEKLNADN